MNHAPTRIGDRAGRGGDRDGIGGVALAQPEPSGTSTTLTVRTADGRDRTAHLYVPEALPDDADVPLLVALHGGTGWGTQ